jgi:predicted nucleic acid-binding protein
MTGAEPNAPVTRVTFYTNILFYALDSDGGDKHRTAAILLKAARRNGSVLLLQSLAELYNAVRKRPNITLFKAQEFIAFNIDVFPVVALSSADLLSAISLQQRHTLHYWDALLIATALRAECTVLLSEDGNHGQNLGNLKLLNPFLLSDVELTSTFVV